MSIEDEINALREISNFHRVTESKPPTTSGKIAFFTSQAYTAAHTYQAPGGANIFFSKDSEQYRMGGKIYKGYIDASQVRSWNPDRGTAQAGQAYYSNSIEVHEVIFDSDVPHSIAPDVAEILDRLLQYKKQSEAKADTMRWGYTYSSTSNYTTVTNTSSGTYMVLTWPQGKGGR
jgi:hypothetical protein